MQRRWVVLLVVLGVLGALMSPTGAQEPEVSYDTIGTPGGATAYVCGPSGSSSGVSLGGSVPGFPYRQWHFARVFVPSGATVSFGLRWAADGDGILYHRLHSVNADGTVGGGLTSRRGTLLGRPSQSYAVHEVQNKISWTNTGPSRDVFLGQEWHLGVSLTRLDWTTINFQVTGGNGDTGPACGDTDPSDVFSVGVPIPGDFRGVVFRSRPAAVPPVPADPIDPTYPHCVVWASDVEERTACMPTEAERDDYVTLLETAVTSIHLLGTHFDTATGQGPSIAVVGLSCDIEINLNGTAWNDLISSTSSVCPAVEHWETYEGGTPSVGLSGDVITTSGTSRAGLGELDNAVSGLRYLAEAPDRFVYVALGDSFASGEGTDQFRSADTTLFENGVNFDSVINDNTLTEFMPYNGQPGNACHRSLINYAKLNADLFESELESILVDRTCSGALADPTSQPQNPIVANDPYVELTFEQLLQAAQPNQALWTLGEQGVEREQVDLVTVSMGGNDAGFAALIQSCMISGVARAGVDEAVSFGPTPTWIEDIDQEALSVLESLLGDRWLARCEQLDGNTPAGLADLPRLLRIAYAQLTEVFPNATILQVNYPRFLPAPSDFPGDTCSWIDRRDAHYARGIADELNRIIGEQVALADALHRDSNGSIRVVDIAELFGTNPLCPEQAADQYFVSIPAGAPARVASRLFDNTQAPGIAIEAALGSDTLGACLGSFLPWVDCFVDDYSDLVWEWFSENGGPVLQGQLATVDPSVPASLRDAAAYENFRTLFHPNAAGFEVIACAVLAEYNHQNVDNCSVPVQPAADRVSIGDVIFDPLLPIIAVPGDVFDIDFPGFVPGGIVDVLLRSQPVDLGSFVAASDGWVRASVTIPTDVQPGVHRITARGVTPSGVELSHTIYVEIEGQPVPGEMFGLHESGFEPFEEVLIDYLGGDFGPLTADERGLIYAEIPVPVYAATQQLPLTLTGVSGAKVVTTITSVPIAVCEGLAATIVGTGLDDNIVGTNGADVIVTGHGNDIVNGLNGDDVICSGPGDDVIDGGNGDDRLYGEAGDDVLAGQNGKDDLQGGPGDDRLEGGNGKDSLDGGSGVDHLDGGRSKDSCLNDETSAGCE